MKQLILIAAIVTNCAGLKAQTKTPRTYRNFPLVITLQFQNLASPFRDHKSNFCHPGIALGTEISFNGKHNWVQQVQAGYYLNRETGNGFQLHTQTAWRPNIVSPVYIELKAGLGATYSLRPGKGYKPANGEWAPAGNGGKWLLTVPAGFSIGYYNYSSNTFLSPFISYQLQAIGGYNRSVPLITNTLIQTGARIYFE